MTEFKTAVSDQPLLDLSRSPMPSKSTLSGRQNVITQFFRFVAFDLGIMRMVLKGHKS